MNWQHAGTPGAQRGREGESSRWRAAAVMCVVLLVPGMAGGAEGGRTYRLASGPKDNNYHRVAEALAESWRGDGELEVLVTEGSFANAELLHRGGADLALMQSDVAYLEYFRGRPYLALAALYTEPLHIVARRELGLQRVSQLLQSKARDASERDSKANRWRIAIGKPGSGTAPQARALLAELGLPPDRYEVCEIGFDEASEFLRKREMDLALITSAVPVRAVRRLAEEGAISLLEIDGHIARRLRRRVPFLNIREIPYSAYQAGLWDARTLGTEVLLVALPEVREEVPEGVPNEAVEALLDDLYTRLPGRPELPFLADLGPTDGLRDLPIPAHPAAISYHQRHGDPYRRWMDWLESYALPILILLAPMVLLFRLSRVAYFVHQFVLGRLLILLIAIWILGSAGMYLIEGKANSQFQSFGGTAFAVLHYLFSGLEERPMTTEGHILAIVILSLGVAVATLFTATVVTRLIEHALNVRRLRFKPRRFFKLRDHVVILGWSARVAKIIRYLRSDDLRRKPTVVVVAPKASAVEVERRARYRNCWLVEGELGSQEVLRRADAARARCALVVHPGVDDGGRDEGVVATTLALRREAPEIHTVAEVRGATHLDHLACCRANEVVQMDLLDEKLISQCVVTPGIAEVYDELLTFGRDSQEIYIAPLPKHLDGRSWMSLHRELLPAGAIPLGYRLGGQDRLVLNPPRDAHEPLRRERAGTEGDALVFLADDAGVVGSIRKRSFPWSAGRKDGSTLMKQKANKGKPEARPRPARSEVRIGICGWNEKARHIIHQLRESVVARHHRFQVTVIDLLEQAQFQALNGETLHENVKFVLGDPTRRRVLENAGVGEFESLVILADTRRDPEGRHADQRSLMVALAASEIQPDLHIVAEVLRAENREHFERLPRVEIVSVEDLAEKLLAQTVISPGISEVFLSLLTASQDTNEIYIVPVPESWIGRSFEELYFEILETQDAVLLLGYRATASEKRPAAVVLNPQRVRREAGDKENGRQHRMAAGEGLVVMAYEEPVW